VSESYEPFVYSDTKLARIVYIFRTQFHVPKDGVFGSLDANQTWNGMIKMILEDEAEFGIGGFVFNLERMAAVHYLPPTRTFK
jgi:hypothetical protein